MIFERLQAQDTQVREKSKQQQVRVAQSSMRLKAHFELAQYLTL